MRTITAIIPVHAGSTRLKNKNVDLPPHKQECYKDWNDCVYPITERIHAQELSIPMNQVVSGEEAEIVVNVLNSFK